MANRKKQAKRITDHTRFTSNGVAINKNGAILNLVGKRPNNFEVVRVGRLSIIRKVVNGKLVNLQQEERYLPYNLLKYHIRKIRPVIKSGGSNLNRFAYRNNS